MNNNRTFVTVSSEMLRNGTKIKKSCHFFSVGNSSMVITRLFFTLIQLSKLSLKNYYLYSTAWSKIMFCGNCENKIAI